MHRFIAAAAAGALVLLASAAAFAAKKEAWSEIDVGKVTRSVADEYAVTIIAIDGSQNFRSRRVHELAPGFHLLHVASTKAGRRGEVTYQPFAIEMKPCTRYSLVAQHDSALGNRRWQVVVKDETAIVSCVAEHMPATAPTLPAPPAE